MEWGEYLGFFLSPVFFWGFLLAELNQKPVGTGVGENVAGWGQLLWCRTGQSRPGNESENRQITILVTSHISNNNIPEGTTTTFSVSLTDFLESPVQPHSVCALSLSCVWLFVTPWTVAHQGPLSTGLSRQEYWSGLPFPSSGHLPDPGLPHWRQILYYLSQQGSPLKHFKCRNSDFLNILYEKFGGTFREYILLDVPHTKSAQRNLWGLAIIQNSISESPDLNCLPTGARGNPST